MEQSRLVSWLLCSLLLLMMEISAAVLSPSGINYEVLALMAIKNELNDPTMSWRIRIGMPSQNLSGTLSPWVGKLTNLQSVGEIPNSLGGLKNLNYLRLNNNSLTGPCPQSLSNIEGLTLVNFSYNNLSGSLPRIPARTLKIVGNPLICGPKSNNCSTLSEPISFPPNALKGNTLEEIAGEKADQIPAFTVPQPDEAMLEEKAKWYFLAEIEGLEQKSDSEVEEGLLMLLDSDLPTLKVDFLELQNSKWRASNCVEK
ncbi:Protein NSP-INTERACTING KINASE [Arachis hypogaea]|nr:Protein NSP-INTERACTING KINASE [Arachis hypogaea]